MGRSEQERVGLGRVFQREGALSPQVRSEAVRARFTPWANPTPLGDVVIEGEGGVKGNSKVTGVGGKGSGRCWQIW